MSRSFLNTAQQQPQSQNYDHQFSNLRCSILPPNQIITKHYQPDRSPALKLLSLNQNITAARFNDAPQDEVPAPFNYQPVFDEDDTLGYHHAQHIKCSLLYLKFDNRLFFSSPQNKSKYLAGLFVPLHTLLKPQLKINKNLYKTLSLSHNLNYYAYQDSVEQSFKPNCLSLDDQVKFSSNYQSANLFIAFKTAPNHYNIILQNDINSKGTTQWFNFTVTLPQPGTFHFSIVNLSKSTSLFQKGMLIPFFSRQSNLLNNAGWTRGCQNIYYSKSPVTRQAPSENPYYTLSFEYENLHPNDIVTFAYCFPYNGIDLEKYMNKIAQKKISSSLILEKTKICQTLSGLPVYVYRIYPKKSISSLHNLQRSCLNSLDNKNHKNQTKNPKGIVFMARQHPGQSQSSFILEGIIDFLLESNEYQNTKRNFHYYIFPMVNVDGVYYGNYRTNLSGNDLNRIWKQPRKDFHPEINSIKKYLYNANRMTQIKLIIDIHGHSSAFNSFFYGNPIKKQGSLQLLGENPKLFPYYCSKQMKQVNFLQCTFNLSEDKKGSARVVLNQMFPKASVYTLENSFFAYKKGKKIVQYTVERYRKLGRRLLATYLEYSKITERVPLIRQKWEKQVEAIYSNMKNSLIDAAEDSDSEAQQQLLQFAQEYVAIDNLRKSKLNQNQMFGKANFSGDKCYRSFQRLYDRKKQKTLNNSNEDQNSKSGYNQIYFQENTSPETNFANQTGFLSIVKIQTKSGTVQTKDKSFNEKQTKQKLIEASKENEPTERQIEHEASKKSPLMARKQKLFKKQYTVRSIQQHNARVRQSRQIQYIDQKEFLMRKRKLINQAQKSSVTPLPNLEFMSQAEGQFKVFGTRANNGTVSRPSEKLSDSRSYNNT